MKTVNQKLSATYYWILTHGMSLRCNWWPTAHNSWARVPVFSEECFESSCGIHWWSRSIIYKHVLVNTSPFFLFEMLISFLMFFLFDSSVILLVSLPKTDWQNSVSASCAAKHGISELNVKKKTKKKLYPE